MSEGRGKKHFNRSRPNRSKHFLEAGQKGFFCTCNFREKDCVKEAYNLLNEYADKLYGSNHETKGQETEIATQQDGGEAAEPADISEQLKQELEELKNSSKKDLKDRRFQSVDTGAGNCVFIRTNLSNPEQVTDEIFKGLVESKQQKTRYLLRILPIMATCKANLLDITQTAGKLFDEHLLKEPSTFSIIFNKRYHSNLSRDVVIESLAQMVTEKNSGNKADLKHPQLAVIVEIIKGICLLSVVRNFYEFKKYNLFEICKKEEDRSNNGVSEKHGGSTEAGDGDKAIDEKMDAANEEMEIAEESKKTVLNGGKTTEGDKSIEGNMSTEGDQSEKEQQGVEGGGGGGDAK